MNRQDDRVTLAEHPQLWWKAVYRDAPIVTQWDEGTYTGPKRGRTPTSSSSMPTMVFSMLRALDLRDGHTVAEVGAGTGWTSGLMAWRIGGENVVSIEVDPETAQAARNRLAAAGLAPLIITGDGAEGYADRAPYDRWIATCSVGSVPDAWREQTVTGGIIVAPWGPMYGGEAVARLTVAEDGTARGPFGGSSSFMRMSTHRRQLPPTSAFTDGGGLPGEHVHSDTKLSPDDVGDWLHMFVIGVQVPDLFCRVENLDGGAYRLWVMNTGVTAWATAEYRPGHTSFPVVQHGPRRLWDELESAFRWWEAQGRPGFERFGLTVDDDGECVWLDRPGNRVPVRHS